MSTLAEIERAAAALPQDQQPQPLIADTRTGACCTNPGRTDDLCRIGDGATFAISRRQTGVEFPGYTPVGRLATGNAGVSAMSGPTRTEQLLWQG